MHDQGQQPGDRIDDQMSFGSGDFLAAIVSARAACFRDLGRLAVEDRGGGRAFSPRLAPHLFRQTVVDPLPDSGRGPLAEQALRRIPVWKILRQIAPGAARAIQVQDRVHDRPAADRSPSTVRVQLGQPARAFLQLLVRHIRGITYHLSAFHRYDSFRTLVRTEGSRTGFLHSIGFPKRRLRNGCRLLHVHSASRSTICSG
jgi:hypothetical protein